MIAEPIIYAPIRYPDWPEVLNLFFGQRIIVIGYDNSWVQCGTVDCDGYVVDGNECWMYSSGGYCSAGGIKVTKEELIDMMSEKYPDHLEWLLFHPELLG